LSGPISDSSSVEDGGKNPRVLEAHARLAIEAAGLGLWEWDVAQDRFKIDATVAGLLGRPALADAPFESREMTDLTHPEDRELVKTTIQDLLESDQTSSSLEHRIIKPTGEQRWLGIKASIIQRSAEGAPEKIAGVVQDLTERKRVELALQAEKSLYDLATSSSPIALWEWEASTGRTRWSRHACEMVGIDPSIQSGDRAMLTDLAHADDVERVRHALFDNIDNGTPFDVDFRMRHSDGHYITVRARGDTEFDDNGQPVRMAGWLTDITAERKAEVAARRAALRSQLALQAAGLGTWEYDARTGFVIMDQTLAELIGRPQLGGWKITREDMFGFTAPEDLESVRPRLIALSKGEIDYVRDEHRVLHADGRRIWIRVHVGVSEWTNEKRPIRLIGIVQDLTEHKRTEAALTEAKDRAEAASAAKSNFLATMSHEIRTPLNGMLGVSQLLALSKLDDKQRRFVETLQSSGRVLAGVIEEILDISKIEAGKLHLSPETVNTTAWLEGTLDTFHATAAQKGLALTWSIDDEAGSVRHFDPQRMAQVLGNLVSNAVKFTDAGSVTIAVTAPSADRLRLQVTDTGPGISDAEQAVIFNRFTQADMTPSREHGGSGLGLAIARELTRLAGGEIGVVSTPGEGATFWFECEAPRTDADLSAQAAAPVSESLKGLRALVVEDNAINRETLVELLNQFGVLTQAVDSGEAALNRLASAGFDVVLLDLHMPGINGFQTLRRIRDGGAGRSDIPVYLVTADATSFARDSANECGATGFFSKPVEMPTLIRTLAELAQMKDRV
jgi:PAS domain S-box-containing protein